MLNVSSNLASQDICTATALEETKLNHITFFPNPASDKINFSRSLENIHIYTPEGKLIKVYKGKHEGLNISEIPEGIYWLISGEYRHNVIILR